jgi:putative PIN family toxin of toxin-antitoxin system
MKNKKVILDTNLWISFLISKDFSFLDNYVVKGTVKLIFSEELLDEFYTVIQRPSLKKYFSKKDLDYLFEIIGQYAIIQNISTNLHLCRDEKDNFLINLAIDSNSDFLVTGDKDLLVLENINQTEIVTITTLKSKLLNE